MYRRDVFSRSTRLDEKRLRLDARRKDSRIRGINARLALVTAITIRLGKHPAGVSSGRTRPCLAVNLASAIISRVRRRPVPSRSRRDATSRRGRWTARHARRHYYVASIPLGRARASAIPALRRGPYAGPLSPPLLRTILGCEEWQHAHIHHRSERKEILHLEVIQFYCRVRENG